jgi:hypothetical protein
MLEIHQTITGNIIESQKKVGATKTKLCVIITLKDMENRHRHIRYLSHIARYHLVATNCGSFKEQRNC